MRPLRHLLFAAIWMAACAGAKQAPIGAFDGGAGGSTAANSRCSPPCPADSACVVATCVRRATEFPSALAVEISPAVISPQAALTEFLSISPEDRVFKTTAGLAVSAIFDVPMDAPFPLTANGILKIRSLIPGRPDLTFEATKAPKAQTIALMVPASAAMVVGMLGLVPLPPADQANPPHWFAFSAPTGTITLPFPTATQTLFGTLVDAFGNAKAGYTARAFLDGMLVSNVATTQADGTFKLFVPATVAGDASVELAPAANADPWFTFDTAALGEPNKNLGTAALPTYQVPQAVVFTVRGSQGEPVSGAALRATTILDPDTSTPAPAGVARFWQSTTTSTNGNASLSLIPGVNQTPRRYDVAVAPPPGSAYASTCFPKQPILGGGGGATISVALRPVLSGTVSSAKGTPMGGVTVTASRDLALAKVCPTTGSAIGPTEFSTTTSETGSFSLPVDPGAYELDFVPAPGSPAPRRSDYNFAVNADTVRIFPLPEPHLIEGDVLDAVQMQLKNATIRIFEPVCPNTDGCTLPPILRAETQADDKGHFRAIVALPSGN